MTRLSNSLFFLLKMYEEISESRNRNIFIAHYEKLIEMLKQIGLDSRERHQNYN